MRLDEAGHDPDIRLDDMPVDQCRRAPAGPAHFDQRARVVAIVIHHPVAGQDIGGQQFLEFRGGVRTVGAGRVEQGDVLDRDVSQLLKQPGDDPVVGGGG